MFFSHIVIVLHFVKYYWLLTTGRDIPPLYLITDFFHMATIIIITEILTDPGTYCSPHGIPVYSW